MCLPDCVLWKLFMSPLICVFLYPPDLYLLVSSWSVSWSVSSYILLTCIFLYPGLSLPMSPWSVSSCIMMRICLYPDLYLPISSWYVFPGFSCYPFSYRDIVACLPFSLMNLVMCIRLVCYCPWLHSWVQSVTCGGGLCVVGGGVCVKCKVGGGVCVLWGWWWCVLNVRFVVGCVKCEVGGGVCEMSCVSMVLVAHI